MTFPLVTNKNTKHVTEQDSHDSHLFHQFIKQWKAIFKLQSSMEMCDSGWIYTTRNYYNSLKKRLEFAVRNTCFYFLSLFKSI